MEYNRPSMDLNSRTPPKWKRPEDIMSMYKMKIKKRALQNRFSALPKNSEVHATQKRQKKDSNPVESKNPFKLPVPESVYLMDCTSVDRTLFRFLNSSNSSQTDSQDVSITEILQKFGNNGNSMSQCLDDSGHCIEIPVDWTLRTKARLLSIKPFPWNQKLKTCEEASGISGFVRCIDMTGDAADHTYNLDTSPNARFHQCCLVWQHPVLPWLELYPRFGTKVSSPCGPLTLLPFKDYMYKEWIQSFHSLFKLVRAKQCPYFYMLSNNFTCLFRAAGIATYMELNALLTPTTRGFRQLLKDEDIEFSMPLKKTMTELSQSTAGNVKQSSFDSNDDTGYNSIQFPNEPSQHRVEKKNEDADIFEDVDDEETEEWLQKMGVDAAEIKRLNSSQMDMKLNRERQIDSTSESLVFVEGVEAQALFNFLINCKSLISTTGQFSGVPPTLLAPVAFTGSTLKALKVRESIVKVGEDKCYHSMEIKGPILPHMVHNLCDLMKYSSVEKFSATFADVESTKAFTAATFQQIDSSTGLSPTKTQLAPSIFGQQNLSDCGLRPIVLTRFCKRDVKQFDSVKYSHKGYSCL